MSDALSSSFDVIIIGAGILGCMTARELARYRLSVLVLESSGDVCTGISRANSAIIYAGQDTRPGEIKSLYTVRACRHFDSLCSELGVRFRRPGSLMVSYGPDGLRSLQKKYDRGKKMGIDGIRMLTGTEACTLEPCLTKDVLQALYVPSTGTVMPWELCIAAAENAAANGVRFHFHEEVTGLRCSPDSVWHIWTSSGCYTAKAIINCAGLQACSINRMAGYDRFRLLPQASDYLVLDHHTSEHIGHILFEEPENNTDDALFQKRRKGLTVIPTVEGSVLAGPSAPRPVTEEHFYSTDAGALEDLHTSFRRLLPGAPFTVISDFSAVRPSVLDTAESDPKRAAHPDCFQILAPEHLPGFYTLTGIGTPGLTASPELGKAAAEMAAEFLGAEKNPSFCGSRQLPFRFRDLSPEKISQLPPSDRTDMICQCRHITRAEILDSIRRCPGAVSLQAIKRRTDALSGRCQGSRCLIEVKKIIEKETGIPFEEIPEK